MHRCYLMTLISPIASSREYQKVAGLITKTLVDFVTTQSVKITTRYNWFLKYIALSLIYQ